VAAILVGGPVASAWTPAGPAKSRVIFGSLRTKHQKPNVLHSESVVVSEEKTESKSETTTLFTPKAFLGASEVKSAASVFGGTVLTFVLSNLLSLGPVQASSVTALFATLVLPEKLALAALCGSFAGMAKNAVIPGVSASLVLGVVCAGMMAWFDKRKWLIGVGGRLGFIAQCACTSQFLVSSLFLTPSPPAALIGAYPGIGKLLSRLPSVSLFTTVGALFMTFWKEALTRKAKNKGSSDVMNSLYKRMSNSVAAVGATGLIASILFPASIAGPAFCGSFIAMSSPAKLERYGALVGASLMGGACQQMLSGVLLGGWGGKLGTASLLGVLGYNMLVNAKTAITEGKESPMTVDT
jgi:hypothetical protein